MDGTSRVPAAQPSSRTEGDSSSIVEQSGQRLSCPIGGGTGHQTQNGNDFTVTGFDDQSRRDLEAEIPVARFGTGQEVVDAATCLATNDYANNCLLNLEGDLSAV